MQDYGETHGAPGAAQGTAPTHIRVRGGGVGGAPSTLHTAPQAGTHMQNVNSSSSFNMVQLSGPPVWCHTGVSHGQQHKTCRIIGANNPPPPAAKEWDGQRD